MSKRSYTNMLALLPVIENMLEAGMSPSEPRVFLHIPEQTARYSDWGRTFLCGNHKSLHNLYTAECTLNTLFIRPIV